jgi:hypothetical protein
MDFGISVVIFILGACAFAAAPEDKINKVAAPNLNASRLLIMGHSLMEEIGVRAVAVYGNSLMNGPRTHQLLSVSQDVVLALCDLGRGRCIQGRHPERALMGIPDLVRRSQQSDRDKGMSEMGQSLRFRDVRATSLIATKLQTCRHVV